MYQNPSDIRRPTTANIDLDALTFNFRSSKAFIGTDTKIMAVIKANAYGHGAVECAKRLSREGIDWFGIALPEEGIELRNAGINEAILCLGGFWPGQEPSLIDANITPVVFTIEQATSLDRAAGSAGKNTLYHVKIDTGMGRLGIRYDDVEGFARRLAEFENIRLEGLMTHFASADDPLENEFTNEQILRFERVVDIFRAQGHQPELTDMANSPGAVAHPSSRSTMVRLGGILYGLGGDVLPHGIDKPELRPVMSVKTIIAQLKTVPAGESLGYGRTFRTKTDSRIAMIPIGYADGLPRALSNNGNVIVNGTLAPIVGRVSMDWTIIDVTAVPGVSLGDEVVVIGSSGTNSILAEDLARACGTISYEITCGFNERVPRIYEGDVS